LLSHHYMRSLLLLLFLAASLFCAIAGQAPPRALPATAPAREFSAMRALIDLRDMTRLTHPVGTPEHEAVRALIMKRLASLGISANVQETFVVHQAVSGIAQAGSVSNIIARLPGSDNSRAVMLVAHYDSAPRSHGASDDGAAIVALLEAIRALMAGQPLRNDLIFLFTDAEEVGLLGAEAFIKEHEWAKDVGLVFNFEARGTSGPSLMFETSQNNGWLIEQFARAVPRPVATSLAYEIYRLLPNDTDFTVFKKGIDGLNFAYINDAAYYHTPLDSADTINLRSLQHHGSYALALAQHFGNLELRQTRAGNAVYFDLFGRALIHYSYAWMIVFMVITCLLFVAALVAGFRRGSLSAIGIVLAFFAIMLSLILSALAVTLVWRLVTLLHGDYLRMPLGFTYNSYWYVLGFAALTTAIMLTGMLLARRKLSAQALSFGVLSWWVLLMCLTTFLVPGVSYLFTWPLLFTLLGVSYHFLSGRQAEVISPRHFMMLAVCAIPCVVLVAPAIYHISHALPLSLVGAVMVPVGLLAGLTLLGLYFSDDSHKWLLPGLVLAIFLCCMVAGSLTSGTGPKHPVADSLFYGLNGDNGQALWASVEAKPDSWTSQFLGAQPRRGPMPEFVPDARVMFSQSEAPAVPLAAPEIRLLGDTLENGGRIMQLRVNSAREAQVVSVYIERGAGLRAASINGFPLQTAKMPSGSQQGPELTIRCYATAGGFDLRLEATPGQTVRLRVVDQSYGLPAGIMAPFKGRPDSIIPAPYQITDSTLVSKSYTFD
jgi:uncharacterized Tic20 family protein